MAKNLYKQDGVNIEEGDSFSSFAGRVCKTTYGHSPFVKVRDYSRGNFRGPRGVALNKKEFPFLEECSITVAPDGSGTKTVLTDAVYKHYVAAWDVVAMTATDITRWGGLPLFFSSVLDVGSLGNEGDETNKAVRLIILGLGAVARNQGFVVLNGETAELGLCVSSENDGATLKFNWAGFMVGVYHADKMIIGDTLQPGQVVVALKEVGFRCNGISSVRKALAMRFGKEWWKNPDAKEAIDAAATPAKVYDKLFIEANGWLEEKTERIPVHLIVHLSGGAFRDKLGKDILFPQGLSAELDDLFEPPPIMKYCAEWRGYDDEELYATWNGGQGAILVLDEDDVERFLNLAQNYRIEAKVCGRITKESESQVRIVSKFGRGDVITYRPK